jgi:hypothetical protein
MAATELIDLFKTMEREIMNYPPLNSTLIKGGAKEEDTQPYKTYAGWLNEIEGYIQSVVSNKGSNSKQRNMNNFNIKDYEVVQERNRHSANSGSSANSGFSSHLEKKTMEERLADIRAKQQSSTTKLRRGKGEWLL